MMTRMMTRKLVAQEKGKLPCLLVFRTLVVDEPWTTQVTEEGEEESGEERSLVRCFRIVEEGY